MRKIANFRLIVLLGLNILLAHYCVANNTNNKIQIDSINQKLLWVNTSLGYSTNGTNTINITATNGTDLYHYARGNYNKSNAPLLLFNADSNFVFTATLSANFDSDYDGAFLIVYSDSNHYAKFLFELNPKEELIVCSALTNGYSDDNINAKTTESKVHFKITRIGTVYGFFYSLNNIDWEYVRIFKFNAKNVKIGFGAQSPVGENCTVSFSNIRYQKNTIFNEF